jgi:hypothetical protein
MAVKLVWRVSAIDKMLKSQRGEVGRYLMIRAIAIQMAAKGQVGKKTGRLAASIHIRHSRSALGQQVKIGSPLNYALAHHEGSKPHVIMPSRAKVLRFSSGGRIIYTRQVNHPGTRPNRYLKDNLYLIRY